MQERFLQIGRSLRNKPYLAYGLMLLLVSLTAWAIYSAVKLLMHTQAAVVPDQSFVAPSRPTQNLGQALEAVHVFGNPKALTMEAGYGMTIVGIFLNLIPEKSRALIALTGQSAQSYAPGETLSNGARIREIFADNVVLVQDGKLVKLTFPLQGIQFDMLPPLQPSLFAGGTHGESSSHGEHGRHHSSHSMRKGR
jgi:type II secretory pathway component PulC